MLPSNYVLDGKILSNTTISYIGCKVKLLSISLIRVLCGKILAIYL